jgi:mRNA interferase HigB
MKVIGVKNLNTVAGKQGKAKQAMLAWYFEARKASWTGPGQIKKEYIGLTIISANRVVFPVYGNSYFLVADINYQLQILHIVWIGTKKDFEQIDVNTIKYA